jgi:hypothetical protein
MKKPQNISDEMLETQHVGWLCIHQFNPLWRLGDYLQRVGTVASLYVRGHRGLFPCIPGSLS